MIPPIHSVIIAMAVLTFSQLYSIIFGGLMLICFSRALFVWLYQHYFVFLFYKLLYYPFLVPRTRFNLPYSPFRFLLQTCYYAGVVLSVTVKTRSLSELSARSALLAVIHFLPLCLGLSFCLPADMLGMSVRTYRLVHGSIGLIVLLLSMTHSATVIPALRKTGTLSVQDWSGAAVRLYPSPLAYIKIARS